MTSYVGETFKAEATAALQASLQDCCPWLAAPATLWPHDPENGLYTCEADIFAPMNEGSQAACESVDSMGLRVVHMVPPLPAAPSLALTAPVPVDRTQVISFHARSRTGPYKYLLAEMYSGTDSAAQLAKLETLETLLDVTKRRYEDCMSTRDVPIRVADITSIIGVAGLVLSAGAVDRDVALDSACAMVARHARPLVRRLMQAGRFFVMVLGGGQMPRTSLQRRVAAVGRDERAASIAARAACGGGSGAVAAAAGAAAVPAAAVPVPVRSEPVAPMSGPAPVPGVVLLNGSAVRRTGAAPASPSRSATECVPAADSAAAGAGAVASPGVAACTAPADRTAAFVAAFSAALTDARARSTRPPTAHAVARPPAGHGHSPAGHAPAAAAAGRKGRRRAR